MIVTDLKIGIRNVLRNKIQSLISIIGLGIGLGSIILLIALIVHENTFNRFIPGYKNVYKMTFNQTFNTQYPLPEEMKKDFPEVKAFFRFNQANNIQVRNLKNEYGRNQEFAFSDTSIFRILGVRMIAGTPATTISEVAISEKIASKFFKSLSPLGEILRAKLNNKFINLTVCGVYKDFPANSTLYPDYIANIKLTEVLFGQFNSALGEYGGLVSSTLNWDNTSFYTYVVLEKNTDKQALASKMQKYTELIKDENSKKSNFGFLPVKDIHLKSAGLVRGYLFERLGNSTELKYYWAISFLILLISITNYILLTRASTSDRFRELGTRKVLGATPVDLQRQIIIESNLITILSLIPASFVIDAGMSLINNTLNRTLTIEVFSNPVMWLLLLFVVIFTGTVSGFSIGYRVSRIPSIFLLSGISSLKSFSKKWDYSFLVFHFSLYVILVASVISVTKQIHYSLTTLKGIDPKNILISELNSPELQAGFTALCSEMESTPGVLKAAGSSFIPPFNAYLPVNLATAEGQKKRFDGLIMGEGMTEMLGIEVIEGSSFGPFQTATMDVLFNESSAREENIKAGDKYMGVFNVKGIVRDFHSHSLHSLIQPMVIIQQNPQKMGLLAIKTDGTNDKLIINRLRELYSQIAPDEIFEAKYLTEQIADFYLPEKNQAKIMGAFSVLATVLAIMGLFGIALISITRKTKEVGLRKVNGATVFEVIYLLNKGFIRWVAGSLIIGIPVSYYIISSWQDRFAYKSELSWWIFTAAGFSAILIAILTVSWQSWRAATRNPVEALRYE
jgi:putative ABC transport system permease protein